MPGIDESLVWERDFVPWLALRPNVGNIVHYGSTEMLNNASDHSDGNEAVVRCAVAGAFVYLTIADDGVGIFERVSRAFDLTDRRLALLELSKGRVTTDPAHHTGEVGAGVFSRRVPSARFDSRPTD